MTLLSLACGTTHAQKFHDALTEEVTGNVKSVSIAENSGCRVVAFNEDGSIVSNEIKNPTRDRNGYITSCDYNLVGHTGKLVFHYDSKKRIAKNVLSISGGSVTQEYTYNSDGYVERMRTTITTKYATRSYSFQYSYIRFDSHGNWTRRNVNYGKGMYQENRSIVYW